MSYVSLSSLGNNQSNQLASVNDPIVSCSINGLEQKFLTGSYYANTVGSEQCQLFTSGYCANNWDGVCEYMSQNQSTAMPAMRSEAGSAGDKSGSEVGVGTPVLTLGEILIRQTAMEKYRTKMSSNCTRQYEPFDPTVANSPLVSKWVSVGGQCVAIYDVDETVIDNDPVMNKILNAPTIAMNVLIPMYNYRKATNTLSGLRNTKLYQLFMSDWFQSQL